MASKKEPAAYKTLTAALRDGVPADKAADHFGVSRRDTQLRRLELGLIKPGPMFDYWTRVKANRNATKPATTSKTTARKPTTRKRATAKER